MKLQNEEVMLKNELNLNWTDYSAVHKSKVSKLLRKKLFVLQYTNINKFEIFHVLHNKIALLTRRLS